VGTEERLTAARASGDSGALAAALVAHAATLIEKTEFREARRELDEAAKLYKESSRAAEQARCLHSAATVCRSMGELDMAESRARRAEKLAPAGTPPRVSATAELAEIAFLRGDLDRAAECYRRALEQGRLAGLVVKEQAALLRKRGKTLANCSRFQEAAVDFGEAQALLEEADFDEERRRTDVELAMALIQADDTAEATRVIEEAQGRATEAADHHVLADLELLVATRDAKAGQPEAALEAARRARKHALEAVAPLSYVGAAVTIAELCEVLGDRAGAYESLAVGWVTAGDVLGEDGAKRLFMPRLTDLRERWGEADFDAIRDASPATEDPPPKRSMEGKPPAPIGAEDQPGRLASSLRRSSSLVGLGGGVGGGGPFGLGRCGRFGRPLVRRRRSAFGHGAVFL